MQKFALAAAGDDKLIIADASSIAICVARQINIEADGGTGRTKSGRNGHCCRALKWICFL